MLLLYYHNENTTIVEYELVRVLLNEKASPDYNNKWIMPGNNTSLKEQRKEISLHKIFETKSPKTCIKILTSTPHKYNKEK